MGDRQRMNGLIDPACFKTRLNVTQAHIHITVKAQGYR